MTARRLGRGLAALAVLLGGCGGNSYPPPPAGKAQIVVKVRAIGKEGIRAPKAEGTDAYSDSGGGPTGRRFQRVDYRRMADIAVLLDGPALGAGGPAPKEALLEIYTEGASRALVLLGPGGMTRLTIANRRSTAVTLWCGGAAGDGFDLRLEPGARREATLSKPGTYELMCDEDECVKATVIVAPTSWAALGESGEDTVFDGVPPGEVEVAVIAPRLPRWARKVAARPDSREILEAEVGVNTMKAAK